jgi:hypothetical protein
MRRRRRQRKRQWRLRRRRMWGRCHRRPSTRQDRHPSSFLVPHHRLNLPLESTTNRPFWYRACSLRMGWYLSSALRSKFCFVNEFNRLNIFEVKKNLRFVSYSNFGSCFVILYSVQYKSWCNMILCDSKLGEGREPPCPCPLSCCR